METTIDGIKLIEFYCEKCKKVEWHLQKFDGGWECLGCRSKE